MSISERRFKQILREEVQDALADNPASSPNPYKDRGNTGFATSIQKGLVKGGTRFIAKKGLRYTLLQGLELAAKSVPGIGSLAAFVDAGVTLMMLLKDMNDFTEDLLKISKVELSGVRSLLGEYSIFEASADDMRRIAAALRQNMTEEQRLTLEEHWGDIMDDVKELIVDLLLTIKEFTFELAIPVAIAIKILPVETPVKYVLFNAVKFLNKQPEGVQMFLRAASFANMQWVMPVIGFLADYDRVSAFIEIDDVITHEVDPGRDGSLKAVGKTAQKGTEMFKYVDMIGGEIADDIAKGFTMESRRRDRIVLIENELERIENHLTRIR